MKNQTHTPTPWRILPDSTQIQLIGVDDKYIMSSWKMENAEFVVKAVNCHDELVEACREAHFVIGIMQGSTDKGNHAKKLIEQALEKAGHQ